MTAICFACPTIFTPARVVGEWCCCPVCGWVSRVVPASGGLN
jgi:hypothetical protein